MYIITILFMLYCSLKALFYGIYEIKENKNKPGGIIVIGTTILGFIIGILLISN